MNQNFQIIFENDDFCVVNKKKGLITHATLDKSRENLFDLLKDHYLKVNKEVFLLHRLDKETSGLMLFSLNEQKNKELQKLIENKLLQKTYLAKVIGTPDWSDEIVLKDFLKKIKEKGIDKQSVVMKGGEVALSRAKVITPNIVQVTLMTGRMHQIRIQLSSRGFPIVGDSLYGGSIEKVKGMCLHSAYLSFSFEGKLYEFLSPPEFYKGYRR